MFDFITSQFGISLCMMVIIVLTLLGVTAYCIFFERKVAAYVQDRYGPNRVGPWGLLQLAADGGKMVLKEDIVPRHVEKVLFVAAPGISMLVAFVGFAAIPWGGQWLVNNRLIEMQVANPDIGLLYIIGVASMGVYGVVLGGWASNNKYSFYGAIRATAQMLSYEIPMGICILVVVLTVGTLRLEGITAVQTAYWFGGVLPQWTVFLHPVPCVLLFITALAECNRTPFDLAEAEQELIGGFHTEYNALKFGMFFLGEYAHMITNSALICVLFLGGWHLPWFAWTQPEATHFWAVLAKVVVLCGKISFLIFVMMWIRWTLPRFRFDQLMRVAWKALIPMTLALFVLAVTLLYFNLHRTIWALVGNIVIVIVSMVIAAVCRTPVTGRAENLPAAENKLPVHPLGASGVAS